MANPLVRRAKKWTYLTWCDLRNHPMMLVGALIGAIAFAVYYVQQDDTNKRIGSVEHTVRVPRRCTVAHLSHTPSNVVILFCNPASKAEIAAAKKRTAKKRTAARRRAHATHRTAARARGRNGRPMLGGPGTRNGNQGVAPSPPHPQQPSRPPSSGSPSRGGSAPSPQASSPPARASPPGITTPPLGPIPSITVPLPSPPLPPLPHLPGSGGGT